jgi:NADH dehydrogenase
VELAGTLGEIANHTLKDEFRSIRPEEARILVMDRSPRVLSTYPEDLSRMAENQLLKLGVRVRTGITVTNIDANGVSIRTQDGKEDFISSRTVIWAAGVAVSEFGKRVAERTGAETQKSGQIKVMPDLTIPNHPEILVVGDLAYFTDKNGNPLPGVAQVAMQGGAYAARTIVQRIKGDGNAKPFHYFNKGDLAVIGRAAAVANIFGIHVSGLLAWLVWLFIHLLYIVEFQNRLLILVEWAFLYFTWNRGARLITGSAARTSVSSPQKALAASEE